MLAHEEETETAEKEMIIIKTIRDDRDVWRVEYKRENHMITKELYKNVS